MKKWRLGQKVLNHISSAYGTSANNYAFCFLVNLISFSLTGFGGKHPNSFYIELRLTFNVLLTSLQCKLK